MITKMPIKHSYLGMHALVSSDVKRGQNLEAEAEARTMYTFVYVYSPRR